MNSKIKEREVDGRLEGSLGCHFSKVDKIMEIILYFVKVYWYRLVMTPQLTSMKAMSVPTEIMDASASKLKKMDMVSKAIM